MLFALGMIGVALIIVGLVGVLRAALGPSANQRVREQFYESLVAGGVIK